MKVLVILSLAAVALAGHSGPSEADVEGQHHRVQALREDFEQFQNKLENKKAQAKAVENKISTLKTRLRYLEGSGCDDEHQFQCGGESPLCLDRLLICDTYDDCPNGADESECDVYTPAGSIWEGDIIYDHCSSSQPDHLKLTIQNYKIIDYLRSYPEVKATLQFDTHLPGYDYTKSLDLTGWMDLKAGEHLLYFAPPEEDGLAFGCTFDGTNNDHCHGQFLYEATEEVCAAFYLKRIDRHH